MNLAKLRHIVAIDRCGSLTAATAAVHVSQSALTKSVADVEADLGFALFERHARGVYATSLGRAYIDRAARIVADVEQLQEDARAGRQLSDSRIRVGVCPPPLVSLINSALPEMLARHRGVRIEQTAGWIEQSIQHLSNRDIDLLIGPAPQIEQKRQFEIRRLAPFEISFFVRKGHPLSRVKRPTLKDLKPYPMALADASVATPKLMQQLFGAPEIPAAQQVHIIGHFPSSCKIVAATDTIGTVGSAYKNNARFLAQYTILNIEAIDPVPLVAAYHSKWLPSPSMLSLIDILQTTPHWTAEHSR